MEKEIKAKIELKLYNYYESNKVLSNYRYKIELLKKQVEEIDKELRDIKIEIPVQSSSLSYEERVQTSTDNSSYAEKMLIKMTDKLLEEKACKLYDIKEYQSRIRVIEADNKIIDLNIKDIDEELRKIIELKYKHKKGIRRIAMELCMGKTTVANKNLKALKIIYSWMSEEIC